MSAQPLSGDGIAITGDGRASGRRSRTPRACLRCRRQKLKCNIARPCSPCIKNKVTCEAPAGDQWRPYTQPGKSKTKHTYDHRDLVGSTAEGACPGIASVTQPEPLDAAREIPMIPRTDFIEESSSTIGFVAEAFNYHQSDSPDASRMSAFPGGKPVAKSQKSRNIHSTTPKIPSSDLFQNIGDPIRSRPRKQPCGRPSFMRPLRVATAEIISALPDLEVINLLVDTYFDRVHWFMLVFHQEPFREKIRSLYHSEEPQTSQNEEGFGFICLLSCVVAIGLQYTCPYRKRLLANLNVETKVLMKDLIATLHSVLLDLVSLGTLESVQVCVLFGSFYLYHGEPRSAWPIIGCAMRNAQALGLHRKPFLKRQQLSQQEEIPNKTKIEEAKRCWWALFEIDRFCSMVYGYPLSMSNDDWDVDLLEPHGRSVAHSHTVISSLQGSEATLLFYKRHMSELSIILGDVLKTLYLPHHATVTLVDGDPRHERMKAIITQISHLDGALKQWSANIEPILRFENIQLDEPAYSSTEERNADIGGSGGVFQKHILRMQTLALKLAYENAVIITHRPLLSFRLSEPMQHDKSNNGLDAVAREEDPFRYSLEACREAALETARLGSHSLFRESLDDYATAFMGMHLFTAGVSLCLMASYEPLTMHAHNAKSGLHQLLLMQATLKEKSILSSQGLEILQKLANLVFSKELQRMINVEDLGQQSNQLIQCPDRDADLTGLVETSDNYEILSPVLEARNTTESHEPNAIVSTDLSFTPDYSFAENAAMAETLFDLGQVLPHPAPTNFHEQTYNSLWNSFPGSGGSIDQEQAWIWGWELFPEAQHSNT